MNISAIPFPNLCVLCANPCRAEESTRAKFAKDAKAKAIKHDEIARVGVRRFDPVLPHNSAFRQNPHGFCAIMGT